MTNFQRISQLEHKQTLSREDFLHLLDVLSDSEEAFLFQRARAVRERFYGKAVWLRGLIEFSSFCAQNCYYCGLRRENQTAERYRLRKNDILACAKNGYTLGFRTFVLQCGEDPYFTDTRMCEIVKDIHKMFPDCAITLSLGERSRDSYASLLAAGAQRYLLRHETANAAHYGQLHPPELSFSGRMNCLQTLRELGFQVGCGFMVGSPGQNDDCLCDELDFLWKFKPEMVGIGPFLPHSETPFAKKTPGSLQKTLKLLALIRLILPKVLLPATTALGTIHPKGREMGLSVGANIVMPNLSPAETRKKYLLYDNKICTGEEAAECRVCLARRVKTTGYFIETAIGHPQKKGK